MRTAICFLAVALAAAVASAQDGIVGVRATRAMNMRGRTFNMAAQHVGVLITKDLVLTPALFDGAESIRVHVPGNAEGLEAEVVETDATYSVLRVKDIGMKPIVFRLDWKPAVGETVHWVGLLAGDLGKWSLVKRAATIDAALEDAFYSDPPFRGPVATLGAVVLDKDGRAVGMVVMRNPPQAEGGGGARGMMRRRNQQGLPVVAAAQSFAHYLSGTLGPRGVLGISGETVSAALAAALGLRGRGVQVTQVTPGSGAAAAGIEAQDVIVAIGDTPVDDLAALQAALRGKTAGSEVPVTFVRIGDDGPENRTVTAKLTERAKDDDSKRVRARRFGFVAQDIPETVRRTMALPADFKGVHVRRVTAGSPAALARPSGLQSGDIIMKVGDALVGDLDALRAALQKAKDGEAVSLFVRSGAQTRFVEVRPEAPDR